MSRKRRVSGYCDSNCKIGKECDLNNISTVGLLNVSSYTACMHGDLGPHELNFDLNFRCKDDEGYIWYGMIAVIIPCIDRR